MNPARRTAFITGALFLVTFVTSIPAYFLYYAPVLNDANYIVGGGADAGVAMGAFLEVLLIIANVGTAVVLFRILRRRYANLVLGYVTARLVECGFIAAGIVFVLGIVSLRQDDPEAASLAVSLAALKDWTFLLGPGFFVGVGNGLILGYLMYRSGLVPRPMTWLGLIGGPLIILSGIGTLFGAWEPGSTVPAITVVPEFLWELLLGIYCTVWGFKRDAPVLSDTRTLTAKTE